ncbi:hypothetical protein CALVIDRAFT_577119 [Calocera viscosa TUFC12733]|uniref:Homeobox domain-containing protein n=1 Tax=Calocera viscosa (strain TUFC12733) TaxID=1330018 RepID=A0A167LSL3_CALVF|nr:hypothetical protein CALVIDRAFT_577119 [Calocera viscosa TUFC12733]
MARWLWLRAREWLDWQRTGMRGITDVSESIRLEEHLLIYWTSQEAARILESAYNCRPNNLNPKERALIACNAGITERQVRVWLQNRRQRGRPRAMKEPFDWSPLKDKQDDTNLIRRTGSAETNQVGSSLRALSQGIHDGSAGGQNGKRPRGGPTEDEEQVVRRATKRSRGSNRLATFAIDYTDFWTSRALPLSTGTKPDALQRSSSSSSDWTYAIHEDSISASDSNPARERIASLAVSDRSFDSDTTLVDELKVDAATDEEDSGSTQYEAGSPRSDGGDTTEDASGNQDNTREQFGSDLLQYLAVDGNDVPALFNGATSFDALGFSFEEFNLQLEAAFGDAPPLGDVQYEDFDQILGQYTQGSSVETPSSTHSIHSGSMTLQPTLDVDANTAFFNSLFGPPIDYNVAANNTALGSGGGMDEGGQVASLQHGVDDLATSTISNIRPLQPPQESASIPGGTSSGQQDANQVSHRQDISHHNTIGSFSGGLEALPELDNHEPPGYTHRGIGQR